MDEKEFHQLIEKTFLDLEERIDALDNEIECEHQEGILTLDLPEGSQVILSRQAVLKELWCASKSGAYHFRYKQGQWVTTAQETLFDVLKAQHILSDC